MSLAQETAGPALFKYVDSPLFAAKPFVIQGGEALTYGALRNCMVRTAAFLADCGIGIGDRIVICCESDLAVIALYLSAMRVGVTPALIDPNSSPDEELALVGAARARAVFVDQVRMVSQSRLQGKLLPGGRLFAVAAGPFVVELTAACSVSPALESYPGVLGKFGAAAGLPDSIHESTSAFILFTSGTTSRPKGVEVSLGAVTSHMGTMHRQYGYDDNSVVMNSLPLHHSDGINHGPVNIMAAGGTLLRSGAFSVQQLPQILDSIARQGVSHLITVPTVIALIHRLGDAFTDVFRTPSFRFISSTAGPLDERLWRAFEERFGTMIVNSYGLTETVCEGFYCGPSLETRRIGTIGKPIDIEVRIIDANGQAVQPGEMGELILRGTCVMKGYFAAPEETDEVLRDGWLHTGDLAVCDNDGFYMLTGRKKNVIICGGINVYPEDVSRALGQMPGIREVVTVGIPDDTWGERVVSCVVPEEHGTPSAEQAIDFCRRHMSREKVPSAVFVVEELPRGASGKVALPEVKRLVAEITRKASASSAARVVEDHDAISKKVFDLAVQCFNASLADLSADSEPESTEGWSSLAHMDFLLALESTFGIKLAPGDMLEIVTLGDAIAYVQDRLRARSGRAVNHDE